MSIKKTRIIQKAELDYIIKKIFNCDDNELIVILIKTNRGTKQVEDLTIMPYQDLKGIKHTLSSTNEELSLILSRILKIQAFKGYIDYLEDKGEKVEDYLAIEKDKFDNFR